MHEGKSAGGRKGGRARAQALSAGERSRIARVAAKARWGEDWRATMTRNQLLTIIGSIVGSLIVGFAIVVTTIYEVDSADTAREDTQQLEIAKQLGKLATFPPRVKEVEDAQVQIAAALGNLSALPSRIEALEVRLLDLETAQRELNRSIGGLTGQLEALNASLDDAGDLPLPLLVLRSKDVDVLENGGSLVINLARERE